MAKKRFGSRVRKFAKRAGRALVGGIKKRYAPKGNLALGTIARDVMMLKRMVNVEKKFVESTIVTDQQFAQANYYAVNITPSIPQGVTNGARTGNSIKLVSARLDVQIKSDTNTVNEFRYKYYLLHVGDTGGPASATSMTTRLFDANIFSSYLDYHSQMSPDLFGKAKIIATGTGKVMAEGATGQTGISQWFKPLKLSQHLKYDVNATSVPVNGAYYLVFFGDTGTNLAQTGGQLSHSIRWWYVDN